MPSTTSDSGRKATHALVIHKGAGNVRVCKKAGEKRPGGGNVLGKTSWEKCSGGMSVFPKATAGPGETFSWSPYGEKIFRILVFLSDGDTLQTSRGPGQLNPSLDGSAYMQQGCSRLRAAGFRAASQMFGRAETCKKVIFGAARKRAARRPVQQHSARHDDYELLTRLS